VQSIEGEILLQQRLMHEHIAQVYEVVRREKKIYIFMEYCPNGELFERIVKNGPMSEKEAARVFQQILSALLYLKRMGVSHRDIKPENVLFDKDWNAKLVDFGFGCRNYADDRMRKTLCGTPSYTPPEVLLRTEYNA
jgi:5'-AMP-activated protein kinase catalytic alpha subunit